MRCNSGIYSTFVTLLCFYLVRQMPATEFNLSGQLSGWIVSNPDQATQLGLRYIPDIIAHSYFTDYQLDAEVSFNMFGSAQFFHKTDSVDKYSDFDAYRLWLRISADQYELRIGLQKLNFGSAMLLRPLMWFDSIDPRDPLQLTDGVYAILGRYFFLDNTNIWIWALYGNDQTRGWEIFTSDKNRPEFGGRIQVPFFTGEVAMTYHYREIDTSKIPFGQFIAGSSRIPENRIGFDGKWDIEIGVWLEGVIMHRELNMNELTYQKQTNIGADYTFDLGNGLHTIIEHFNLHLSEAAFGTGEGIAMTALSLNYPIGLLDDITMMLYYDWDNTNWYRFFSWQRTYDNWRFYLMGFWNPDQYQLFRTGIENNLYAGKGIQLMVVFNH